MSKRYVTIDFLRGLAIWIMVFLHALMRWIDQDAIIASLDKQKFIIIIIYLAAIFLGGWCGFFLLVSAIGNMVSMQKGLEKGLTPMKLAIRQVVGGLILLVFAMLSQSLIGYQAALGTWIKAGFGNIDVSAPLNEGMFVMEAIHAVAYCVIFNGIVQTLLSINNGHEKRKRNIIIYLVLAVLVLGSTQFVWNGIDNVWAATGFSGRGYLSTDSLGEILLEFVLMPFFLHPEPIFPYLAVSFIGSAIGIWLTSEKPNRKVIKYALISSLVILFIGLAGVAVSIVNDGAAMDILMVWFWSMPHLTGANFQLLWMWCFLVLTAAQVASVFLVLRVVEFRGRSQTFAKRTKYWRRFGFVAFSIYNGEFWDVLAVFLFTLIPGVGPFGPNILFNEVLIWPVLLLIFLLWQGILILWEKVHYVFSLEWFISKISSLFIKSKRDSNEEKRPWWKDRRLDPEDGLLNITGIDIRTTEELDHVNYEDSRLAMKLTIMGFIFFPLIPVTRGIIRQARITEGNSKKWKSAHIINLIQLIILGLIFIAFCILSLSTFGIPNPF